MKPAVTPKKHLGQHFLNDKNIAEKVALLFKNDQKMTTMVEIGPGMGVLTDFLIANFSDVVAIEIDNESVQYLNKHIKASHFKVIETDFLKENLSMLFQNKEVCIVGNFPYNISSQIVFKILENPSQVIGFGGMFQKEVAERLVAKEGSKTYGILSVLLNTYYQTEYQFTVAEHVFIPPPKVKSGVIKCLLKTDFILPCDKKLYFEVVKMAFNQRRKMLRNALHKFNLPESHEFAKLRAEQLSVENFLELTQYIEQKQ